MNRAVNISPLRAFEMLLEGEVESDRAALDDVVEVVVATPSRSSDRLKARETRTLLASVDLGG